MSWDEHRQCFVASLTVGYAANGKRIVRRGMGKTEALAKTRLKERVRDYGPGWHLTRGIYTVRHAGPWTASGHRRECHHSHVSPLSSQGGATNRSRTWSSSRHERDREGVPLPTPRGTPGRGRPAVVTPSDPALDRANSRCYGYATARPADPKITQPGRGAATYSIVLATAGRAVAHRAVPVSLECDVEGQRTGRFTHCRSVAFQLSPSTGA